MQQDIAQLREWLANKIVGQEHLIERLMIALLADGHLLVEGAPGLAKTKAIKTLSEGLEADFHRVQFTPDLLPADITGSDIYRPQQGTFEFQAGPLFHNLVLADEINRAPAKVQSALLEAMAERQISVGKNTYPLPDLFLVMATQNPIEQEGTYPLPEAQMDRFLMHILVGYPAPETERAILALSRQEALNDAGTGIEPLSQKTLFAARQAVNQIHMTEAVEEYLVQLILATRNSESYGGDLAQWLDYGASPRATIALDRCSRSLAWMEGRDFVTPDDIRAVAHDVLRHRLILSFEAEANGITANQVIDKLLDTVPSA
ncbi:MAG: MoxR family ATPase [Porticoccaceae bacterium]|nr:MoxR family ATPase [Porticoccaceae bacterium]MDA8598294.1 MoxR family ATPase [Porticoccaceae bacterium]MDA8941418.1 MoxR family ATPase [Porticoccaceae bacterium]MDG1244531.1 MoxR family ATPase [Porticoccaceae bacterium]MDG1782932.1 MoxR family ATPase [Porticoccaceae bacterium]